MLKGITAVVTGSTSGIGLGIAEGFAKEGVNLVLNGFGGAAKIEKIRASLASRFGIKVTYDGADMRKPVQIEAAQPTKQFVTTAQVADTAIFLCSEAAASITDTNIMVEGGWTAH